MIYCPNCKKPSARADGTCPHCGVPLGSGAPPGRSGSRTRIGMGPMVPGSSGGPASSGPAFGMGGEVELEMDHAGEALNLELDNESGSTGASSGVEAPLPGGGGSLDLASVDVNRFDADDDDAPVPGHGGQSGSPVALAELMEAKVRQVGDFGIPAPGVLGTFKYGMRVSRRLKELAVETVAAKQKKDDAWSLLEADKAALGRRAYEVGHRDESLVALVAKALRFDGEIEGARQEEEKLTAVHEEQIQAIDASMKEVEALAAPIRQEEIRASAALEGLVTDQKRAKARVKRSDIELRNIRDIIEKRQQEYADLEKPKDVRDELLRQIAEFDNRQPPIFERLKEEKDALLRLNEPLAKARETLEEIRNQLSSKNEEIAALRGEKARQQASFEEAVSVVRQKAQGESANARKAWAQVGERIYVNRAFQTPDLMPFAIRVKASTELFFGAGRTLEAHEMAIGAYDSERYAEFKKLRTIGLLSIGGLLLVICILAAVW